MSMSWSFDAEDHDQGSRKRLTNAELIAGARQVKPHSKENCGDVIWALVSALEAAEAELTRSALPSKDALDQCMCTAYSQDAGGGYFEPLVEQDPACPVHSEYVFDPKVAAWVHRDSLAAVPERTLTDADLDRFETTAEPIYRSTIEAGKASKFLVSGLAQWVMRLTAEVRHLSGAPVSLEAVKAATTWEYGVTYVEPARPVSFSTSLDKAIKYKAFYDDRLAKHPATYREAVPSNILRRTPGVAPGPWHPVSTEGAALQGSTK